MADISSWASLELQKSWERTRKWEAFIVDSSEKYGFDPLLIATVIWWESGGNPGNRSEVGAVGLMQVMPSDANHPCGCFGGRPTTKELLDPEFNIDYGTRVLLDYYEETGDIREALRRYHGASDPAFYADRILSLYERLKPP